MSGPPRTLSIPARAAIAVIFVAAAMAAARLDSPTPVLVGLSAAAAGVVVWMVVMANQPLPTAPDPRRSTGWRSNPYAEALLAGLDAPAFLASPAGYVVLANTPAVELLSPSRALVGRALEEIFTKAEILDLIASARRGIGKAAHVKVPTSDGVQVLDIVASPLPEALTPEEPAGAIVEESSASDRRGVIVTVRDITDTALASELKTDFVANASHELRTPISAIRLAVDTLDAAGEDPAMRGKLLGMINRHTTRLDELVRDMLDLSKLESPDHPVQIREFDAHELLQELAEGLSEGCRERGLTLAIDLPPEFGRLRSDRRILMLILKNLTENATKFAEEGSTVRVVGEVLRGIGRSPGARFRVIDRGTGIPLDQQQRIFERFYQVDGARSEQDTPTGSRGTGLGLAIVKHGVRALGGVVAVDSVWQKGTTMTVDLPGAIVAEDADATTDGV